MLRSLASAHRLHRICQWRSVPYSTATREGVNASPDTDKFGVPLQPTWSVRALLESYPRPTLSAEALAKLHRLSALIPPEEGSPAHAQLTAEMEDLVKLVEAVRIPELTREEKEGGIPDGRIWAHDRGIELDRTSEPAAPEDGRKLLGHAAKTESGLYVVEADRIRTPLQ